MKKLIALVAVFIGIGLFIKKETKIVVVEKKSKNVASIEISRKPSTVHPEIDQHDHDHKEQESSHQISIPGNKVFSESETGRGLSFIYDALELTSEDAQILIDNKIEELRENPEVSVAEIKAAYHKLERAQFTTRYKLVFMLESLELPEARELLTEIAVAPIPTDLPEYQGDGSIDHVEQEVLVRVRALGGLELLQKSGKSETRETIYDVLTQTEDRTLKNTAVRAWLMTSSDLEADKEALKQVLETDDHYMISTNNDSAEDHGVEFEVSSI